MRPFPPITDVEQLDDDGQVGEALMMGLRLIEGIDSRRLASLLSRGERGDQRAAAIERHTKGGLLVRRGGRMQLSHRGLLLADTVISDLL